METTKYESVFKNPEGFTQQEITQLRTKVIAFSRALVGRRLAIPVSDNLDLNYKKKIAGDMNNESTYSNKNPYVKDDEGKLDHIFGMNGARPLLEAVVFKSFVISDHFGVLKSFAITQ